MMKVIFRNSQFAVVNELNCVDEQDARKRTAELLLSTPIFDGDKIEFHEE